MQVADVTRSRMPHTSVRRTSQARLEVGQRLGRRGPGPAAAARAPPGSARCRPPPASPPGAAARAAPAPRRARRPRPPRRPARSPQRRVPARSPLLDHPQRDAGRRVRLRQRAEPQLAAGRACCTSAIRPRALPGAPDLRHHRRERRVDGLEALRDDQAPQQRRARVPVLDGRAGARAAPPPADAAASSPARPPSNHRHAPRDGERLGRRARRRPRREPLEHRHDPRRAARVVQPADRELPFQAGGERPVGVAELGQRPLHDVDRVHPAEQRAYASASSSAISARSRGSLDQRAAPPPAARTRSRGRRSPRPAPPRAGRRPARPRGGGSASARRQQLGRRLRRAAPSPPAPPRAGAPAPSDRPPGRSRTRWAATRPAGAPSACSSRAAARCARPLVAPQRRLDARRGPPDAGSRGGSSAASTSSPHEPGGQPRGLRRVEAGDRRRVPQLAAVAEHGQRLREAERARLEAADPRRSRAARCPAAGEPRRLAGGPSARPRAAARPRRAGCRRSPPTAPRTAPSPAGPPSRGAHDRGDGRARSAAPAGRTADASPRSAAERRRRRRLARAQRDHHRAPAARRPAVRGTPASAATARPPSARRRPRSAPAGCAARLTASQYRPCTTANDCRTRRPRPRPGAARAPRRPGRPAAPRARGPARQAPLEQLPHDAEREARLQLRAARVQHLVAELLRAPARRVDQRRLADAGAALDHQDAAAGPAAPRPPPARAHARPASARPDRTAGV